MATFLMEACTSEPTWPHVDIARETRGYVPARYFPPWRGAFFRLELAQGLTMVMSSRSAIFLRQEWLSKRSPASVAMPIRRGLNLPLCTLALSRKGHVSSTTYYTLLSRRDRDSAWRSNRLWMRELHPVFMKNMAWRQVVSCQQSLP